MAANGTVIEQAQILTTHNLAALTAPVGVGEEISVDWPALAGAPSNGRRCRPPASRQPRRLPTVTDLASA